MNMRMYIVAGDIAVRHRELTEQLVIETDPTPEKVEGLFNDSAKPSSRGRYAIPLTMKTATISPTHRKLCNITAELHNLVPSLQDRVPRDETLLVSSTRWLNNSSAEFPFQPVFTQLVHEDAPAEDIPDMSAVLFGMFSTTGMSTLDVVDDTGSSPVIRRLPFFAGDTWGTLVFGPGDVVHRGSSLGLAGVEMEEHQWPPHGGQQAWWRKNARPVGFQMDIRTHFYSTDPRRKVRPGELNGTSGDLLRWSRHHARTPTVMDMEGCMQWDDKRSMFQRLGRVHRHPAVAPPLWRDLKYPEATNHELWFERLRLDRWRIA